MSDYDAFVAFARAKDPDDSYTYLSNGNCAYAQFLKETGRATRPLVGSGDWWEGGNIVLIDPRLDRIDANEDSVLSSKPHTWGGIVNRLENAS